jgi:hypothetical protein
MADASEKTMQHTTVGPYRVAYDEATKTYPVYFRDAIVHREKTANAAHLWINEQLAANDAKQADSYLASVNGPKETQERRLPKPKTGK